MQQKRESGKRKRITRDSRTSSSSNRKTFRSNDDKPYSKRVSKRGYKDDDDRRENRPNKRSSEDKPYPRSTTKRSFNTEGEKREDRRIKRSSDNKPYPRSTSPKSSNAEGEKREDRRFKRTSDNKPYPRSTSPRSFNAEDEKREDRRFNKNTENKPFARGAHKKRTFTEDNERRDNRSFPRNEDKPYPKGVGNKRDFREDKESREDRPYKRYDDEGSKSQPKTRKSYGKPASKQDSIKTSYKPYIKKPFKDRDVKPVSNLIRLNKFISNAGICSRREADEYIKAGVVSVNGKVIIEMGTHINPKDQVKFNNQSIKIENKIYLLLNKPKDFVTTIDDPHATKTVMDLVRNACRERIYPVGRLDKNTTGLLLFTNDGDLTKRLTHPKYRKKKIYHAFLNKNITKSDMQKIADGIELEDGFVQSDAISFADPVDKKQVGIEIHSGKNRIVRRMFEHLDYKVVKLDRVYFAGLTKKNLPRGKWRFLSQKEMNMLQMNAFE